MREAPSDVHGEESQRQTYREEAMEDYLTDFGSVVMVVIIAVSAIIIFTMWVLS